MRKALIGRTGDWLARTTMPKVTMTLAFVFATASAYGGSLVMESLGLKWLGLRLPLCFLAGYAGYVFFLGTWRLGQRGVDTRTLMENATAEIETWEPYVSSLGDDGDPENPFGSVRAEFDRQFTRACADAAFRQGPLGVAIWLLLLAALGAAIVMAHRIGFARWYLGELLALSGKVRHSTRNVPVARSWPVIVFDQTIWEATALTIHYALIGLMFQSSFPQAGSIADVIQSIR